jgi:DNA gyrase/topoisomerase IV subunit A
MAQVLTHEETSIFLVSQGGHVIHFELDEINLLAGVGKGVLGIKLDDDDCCIGGFLITRPSDAFTVETSGGRNHDFTGRLDKTSRGGKGHAVVKRTQFTRLVPPAITLVNWDELEAEANGPSKGKNGHGKTLFGE